MMVSARGVACVLALLWACCCTVASQEGAWGEVKPKQQAVEHVMAKHEGVQEDEQGKKDKQTPVLEDRTLLRIMPQDQWKALQFLLEKARKQLPVHPVKPKAVSTVEAEDWQGDEPWLEPRPWPKKQSQKTQNPHKGQPQQSSTVKQTWLPWNPKPKKPVSSKGGYASKSHREKEMDFPALEFDDISPSQTASPNLTTGTQTQTRVKPAASNRPYFSGHAAAEGNRQQSSQQQSSQQQSSQQQSSQQQSSQQQSSQQQSSQQQSSQQQSSQQQTNEVMAPESLSADCGESLLHLQVKRDFFGVGQLISPADVMLGDCAPAGFDPSSETLLFETELHTCGSTVEMTDSLLVYTFALSYVPEETSAVRFPSAMVNISCQYPRLQSVSSSGLMPEFHAFSGAQVSEGTLDFSLKLMNDDWSAERASVHFFLGEVLNIEASVRQLGPAPLHVFVEECVASPGIDDGAQPVYYIIEKDGCLMDSKLDQSRSQFMPNTWDRTLRFQLETFRFAGVGENTVYLTCTLKAVLNSTATDHAHKACHFSKEMDLWVNADGADELCRCCDEETCPKHRVTRSLNGVQKQTVVLGPIDVQKRI